jgi:FkbM family methyltransferase
MHVIRNAGKLLGTPGMSVAYARYLWHGALGTPGPFLPVARSARIGHWVKFSEYWSHLTLDSRRELAFVARHCKAGGIGVDVGAHIGLYTLAMLDAGLDRVHSFEPIPATTVRLRSNLALNGAAARVTLHSLGVGKCESRARFEFDAASPSTSRLFPQVAGEPAGDAVQVVSLDSFASSSSVAEISMLKIDVEGMELDVLLGAERLLAERRIHAGIIEICPGNLAAYGTDASELLAVLRRHGYTLALLDDDGLPSIPAQAARLRETPLDNAVFFPA